VSDGDWTLEAWTSSSWYVTGVPIRIGLDLKNGHNGNTIPKPKVQLKLSQAADGLLIRESRPEVGFQQYEDGWRGHVEDAFAQNRSISPGLYLLEVEITLDSTILTLKDEPITIKAHVGGY
jgi:hypothetical protein